ncbi:hypothetical protein [Mucilaginibacter celer]|uniref:Uncharacterized protein n=1 Tax=Mucilaginibacter celer TaxID=2305508 RepID=A0A494VXE2_9SPHI|nr:hypothetical protein [Mucilaginibacter celer]AYL96143.1 hypothetical protein HYN43_012950 [Mucilaginibacter celer]
MERELRGTLNDVNGFLSLIRPYCTGDKARFEISWTLRPGCFEKYGRLNYWMDLHSIADGEVVKFILNDLNAPQQIKNAFEQFTGPLCVGFGFATTGGWPVLRLYLHGRGRKAHERAGYYEAWRWDPHGTVKKHVYTFQFHSDITGSAVSGSIPAVFTDAFNKMTGNERFKQTSGYWIRKDAAGITDNIYLALPWMPPVGQLPGIDQVLNDLNIPDCFRRQVAEFPVRNFGYKIKNGTPEITIYTPGEIFGEIPDNEAELQYAVLKAANEANAYLELFADALQPGVTGNQSQPSFAQVSWDGFSK